MIEKNISAKQSNEINHKPSVETLTAFAFIFNVPVPVMKHTLNKNKILFFNKIALKQLFESFSFQLKINCWS